MRVSIVFCTARRGGLDILERSIAHQTYRDLEVIVLDELHRKTPFVNVVPPSKKQGMHWNLSASLNAGCRAATGEIIVLLQDYIWMPPDAIEKYVRRFEQEGREIIVSGVGHQYADPCSADDLDGLHSIWTEWPGEPRGAKTFTDPRAAKNGFYLTCPVEWEANWGAFPKKAWVDIGGFDEDFDASWGYDNCNFAERCQIAGYHVFLDTLNEVLCYDHILLFNEQKHRNESPNGQSLWHKKYRGMTKGGEPWKLNYA